MRPSERLLHLGIESGCGVLPVALKLFLLRVDRPRTGRFLVRHRRRSTLQLLRQRFNLLLQVLQRSSAAGISSATPERTLAFVRRGSGLVIFNHGDLCRNGLEGTGAGDSRWPPLWCGAAVCATPAAEPIPAARAETSAKLRFICVWYSFGDCPDSSGPRRTIACLLSRSCMPCILDRRTHFREHAHHLSSSTRLPYQQIGSKTRELPEHSDYRTPPRKGQFKSPSPSRLPKYGADPQSPIFQTRSNTH